MVGPAHLTKFATERFNNNAKADVILSTALEARRSFSHHFFGTWKSPEMKLVESSLRTAALALIPAFLVACCVAFSVVIINRQRASFAVRRKYNHRTTTTRVLMIAMLFYFAVEVYLYFAVMQ